MIKAVYECTLSVTDMTKEQHQMYLNDIIDENFSRIASLVLFDDDLLLYGGDIELTEDEIEVKKKMQKLKEDFDSDD